MTTITKYKAKCSVVIDDGQHEVRLDKLDVPTLGEFYAPTLDDAKHQIAYAVAKYLESAGVFERVTGTAVGYVNAAFKGEGRAVMEVFAEPEETLILYRAKEVQN